MNKRFMSLLLVLVMVFSLLPISAMAEVYIFDGKDAIELDFYRNSSDAKPFNTQRVLTSGINAIYDPGCELAENTVFLGWQVNGQGDVMDIAGVRTYVTANAETLAGKTLKLVASVSPVRYLVYNDESGRVVKTEAVIHAEKNSWETDVDYDYTPVNVNSDFFGWTTTKGSMTVEYENKSVAGATHPTRITLDANTVNLYPVCKSGYWVTFNENDKWTKEGVNVNIHATYQPPVFVLDGETLNPNSGEYPVTAQGYTLDGWYDEAGNLVTEVSEATTVYAKWTAQTVKYKIAYWQQNANPDENGEYGYSVVTNSIVGTTGTAGEFATYDKDAARDQYDHFTLNETKSDNEKVVIAGDGSAVKNVYFDRDEYTLTFGRDFSYRDTGRQFVTVDETFYLYSNEKGNKPTAADNVEIEFAAGTYETSAFNGLYYYHDGWTSNRLEPCISESTFYYNYESFAQRDDPWNRSSFESIVAEKEPYGGTIYKTITAKYGEYIGDQFPITGNGASDEWRWEPKNSSKFSNVLVYIDTMPAENATFERNTSDASLKYIQFYVEPLPGQTGTEQHGGKTYVAYHDQIKAKYNWFTEAEDYVDLYGFAHDGSEPAFSDGTASVSSGGTLKLYYLRNEHTLSFDTGDSVKPADVTVKYDEPMASHDPGYKIGDTRDRSGRPIIFQGWYDNAAYAGSPYDFSSKKMPDADVMLYAKWADARYAVELMLDGGQMPEGAASKFKVDYNGTVDITNNPTKIVDGEEFEFVGWYTDPELTQRFNLDTHLNETVVKDTSTDPDDSTVHGKLMLYAKWRHKMDSETYLTVVYDANGGTNAPTDTLHYADQAEAIAKPASKSTETGESFSYWEVLGKNNEPTGVNVYPGDIFSVKLDDAVKNVVTLRAHYETSKATHIIWFGNGGVTADNETAVESADANLNSAIKVKPANTFTREGYVFLGWARLGEAEMKNADGSWKTYDGNELWLTWDGEHYTAVNDQGVTVTDPDIAANEVLPHHVLYAVWDQTDNHNYVIDYNGKMTIATSATAKKDDSHNNGAFDVAGGIATYQLKNTENTFADGADLAFNGIDTALINGVPVGSAEGATASWEKYSVIPANNVYFDDSLVNASMVAGDDNSIKAAVKANENSPENGQEKTSLVFTFYGTGIDVYCTTDATAGWIQANVDGTAYPFVNSRYQESEGSTTAIYNTPVISIDGLDPNVKHTLTLRTLTNSNFRLDGIRVYNPMQGVGDEATQATVNKAYDDADESNAVFLEVRDRILAAGVFSNGATDTDVGNITGAVFLETKAEGATIADYTAKGPKDEVYLAPDQAIAFNLGGWTDNTYKVMVGLSMPKSTDTTTYATVYASGRGQSNPITVSARTDMFYQIYPDANGNVIIKNNGSGMISITKLKITTIAPNGTAYAVPAQTTGEAVEPGTRGLQVNRSLMAYAMAFDPATEVSPTDNVEEPDTPEEPDDPKPGWNDGAFNPMSILKNLFQNLLDGLGKLFGNLPKW